ncbi:MAG: dihydrolipoamide acetyltransferase family protein [Pseudomonadota bacterium]
MSEYVFKLPDLGEGTVEAEIVHWHVGPGDAVREGDVVVDVMTEKANVEVPAPVDGTVLRTTGEPGDLVAVGSELLALQIVAGASATELPPSPEPTPPSEPSPPPEPPPREPTAVAAEMAGSKATPAATPGGDRVITSPAIRRRAKEAGIDLRAVPGSGPRGRILRRDLDAVLEGGAAAAPAAGESSEAPADAAGAPDYEAVKVIGVRRIIAERMSKSKREIPHFAYVEEVDVTELEGLREHLSERYQRRLTILPFIASSLIRAVAEFPQCNARYEAERGEIRRYRPVHLGVATQTPDGLKVPVVGDAQRLGLWSLAEEIARVAEAARDGRAGPEALAGSTITVTSLGRMGGIVTTPVINYPEVAIIGVNKIVPRPVVVGDQVRIRTMMNLSSSFDHRFVDGFDAAAMIQYMKGLLEHPATLFLEPPA